jgi:hypothetical protein
MSTGSTCSEEPWGRYSASGGLFALPPRDDDNTTTTTTTSNQYIYSFGGDTQSDADNRGGVVRTNWRYDLSSQGGCWEQLANGPTEIGYRATSIGTAWPGMIVAAWLGSMEDWTTS